jgi:hypothetical protein
MFPTRMGSRRNGWEGLLEYVQIQPAAVADHEEAEGHDHDGENRLVLDRADDHALYDDAAQERGDEGGDEGPPVGKASVEHGPREVGGEHGHLALGEVHHVGGLVDHHEREREARVDSTGGQPGHHLLHEYVHALLSSRGMSGG